MSGNSAAKRTTPSTTVGTAIPIGDDWVMVQTGCSNRSKGLNPADSAATLVPLAAKVLGKPGLDPAVVFGRGQSKGKRVYAYSVFPADPSKIIRQTQAGKKEVGEFVNGKFKVIPKLP